MRTFKRSVLALMLGLSAAHASAAVPLAGLIKNDPGFPNWTHTSAKFRLIAGVSGHVLVMEEVAHHCLIPNKPEYSTIIATINTAMAMGKKIIVYSNGWNNVLKIANVPVEHNGDIYCNSVVIDW